MTKQEFTVKYSLAMPECYLYDGEFFNYEDPTIYTSIEDIKNSGLYKLTISNCNILSQNDIKMLYPRIWKIMEQTNKGYINPYNEYIFNDFGYRGYAGEISITTIETIVKYKISTLIRSRYTMDWDKAGDLIRLEYDTRYDSIEDAMQSNEYKMFYALNTRYPDERIEFKEIVTVNRY